MPNVIPQTTSDEHSKSLKARRVVIIDPSDGGALGSESAPLNISLIGDIAGEDISKNVLGISKKPTISAYYSGIPGVAAYSDVDILVKNVAGQLMMVACNNKNAEERFLWVKNKATVIAAADTVTAGTDIVMPLPASTNALITFGEDFLGAGGMNFATGTTIGVSTSATSFTAATTTDHYVVYFYA